MDQVALQLVDLMSRLRAGSEIQFSILQVF